MREHDVEFKVRMPSELLLRIINYAKAHSRSKSSVAREALERLLDELEGIDAQRDLRPKSPEKRSKPFSSGEN